jgi:sugar lactone lactonase YvrE
MQPYRNQSKLRWLATGIALLTLLPSAAHAQAPASGVQATASSLARPAAVAFDSAGNLYIADRDNHVVREVNTAGIITTIAGTGEQGFSGDGGAATGAQLDSPSGVAIDAAGNVYIADTRNHRVRKVSGGTIATIAGTGTAGFSGDGGPSVSAALNNPSALALDSNGNLYIADTDNHRIRKIAGTTITTVAGNGEQFFSGDGGAAVAAGLDSPAGVAVDSTGNIYISDTRNQRVRIVNAAGNISTLAGNGTRAYVGDGAAATAAALARPRGLSVDAQGNIYFADSDNNAIRLIGNTGTITTVAGNGSQGFAGDGGLATKAILDTPQAPAVKAAGGFALSDTNNNLVREVSSSGIINTISGVSPGIGGGQGVGGETLTIAGTSTSAYGSGTLTVTFSNGANNATGQVSLVETGGSSTPIASAPISSNVAAIDISAISAGTHRVVASYSGDSQNPAITSGVFVLTVTPLPVTASVTAVSLQYGQTVPAITGTLTGILPQDVNNVTAVFTTIATSISSVGSYAVGVTLTGSAAGNYALIASTLPAGVVIGKAISTIALTSSVSAPFLGAPVTLTARVASTTTGAPSGTVSFYDGATLLTTAPINAGVATYTSSSFAGGSHSLTALYSGDSNFLTATSAPLLQTVSSIPDFSIAATGTTTQSANPGQTATFSFAVQPQVGTFTSPVTLSASGLPTGATAVFTPATIPSGSGATTFTVAIKTAALTAASKPRALHGNTLLLPASAALLLLPFGIKRRTSLSKASRRLLGLILLLAAGAVTSGLTGCGSGGFFPNSPQSYTITVTATANSAANTTLQHTATVTLTVQ